MLPRGRCRSTAAQAKLRGPTVAKVRLLQWGLLGSVTTILLVRSVINYHEAVSLSHHAPDYFSRSLLEDGDPVRSDLCQADS